MVLMVVVALQKGLKGGLKGARHGGGGDGGCLVLAAGPHSILVLGLGAKSARLNGGYHRFGGVCVGKARQIERGQAAIVAAAAAAAERITIIAAAAVARLVVALIVVADEAKVCQRLADEFRPEVYVAEFIVV
jgi:hypothetical protein